MDEIIENEQVEETPKPKRTRRKKAEPKPETVVESQEIGSKAAFEEKPTTYRARVATALLNVREQPTKASKAISTVKLNDVLEIASKVDGWGKLERGGYVMLRFVEEIK